MELPDVTASATPAVSLRTVAASLDLEAGLFARAVFERIAADLRCLFDDLTTRQDPVGQEWLLDRDWDDTLEPTFCWRYLRELACLADEAAGAWAEISVRSLTGAYDEALEGDPERLR